MNRVDALKLLGISTLNPSDDEIKKAYRSMAKKHHPDVGGNENDFKEMSNAYDFLINKKGDAFNTSFNESNNGWEYQWTKSSWDEYISNFESFYKRNSNKDSYSKRGVDVIMDLELTLEEGYNGVKKEISIYMKTISVNIPRGVKTGSKLRIKDYGQRGYYGGDNGDLIINIKLTPHKEITLSDDDFVTNIKVGVLDAVLGSRSSVTIFDKKIDFKIPPRTNSSSFLRIKGRGYPKTQNPSDDDYGDLYLILEVVTKADWSDEQIELFKKIKQLENESE